MRHNDIRPMSGHISREDAKSRVLSRVRQNGDCWEWTGSRDEKGYGRVRAHYRRVSAHRLSYYAHHGDTDMQLDHLCRNRWCVNPAHLEPVTTAENVLRGQSAPAKNARKTHCSKGHDLSDAYSVRLGRQCRTCQLADNARRRSDMKARDPVGYSAMRHAEYLRGRAKRVSLLANPDEEVEA